MTAAVDPPTPGPTPSSLPAAPPARRYRLVHVLFFVHLLLLVPAVILVLALASCGGTPPAGTTPPPASSIVVTREPSGVVVHRDTRCSSYDVLVERQRELADRNAAALARALAEAALTPVDYPADGIDGRLGGNDWEVVEASGRRDLLSPSRQESCVAGGPWRLALDSRGGVVALLIQARVTDRHELLLCGCDLPITCGGAAPPIMRTRWALPPGVDFHGPFSLVVDDQASMINFAGRPDHAPCPIQPLPP